MKNSELITYASSIKIRNTAGMSHFTKGHVPLKQASMNTVINVISVWALSQRPKDAYRDQLRIRVLMAHPRPILYYPVLYLYMPLLLL